jgi:hypothetical protein
MLRPFEPGAHVGSWGHFHGQDGGLGQLQSGAFRLTPDSPMGTGDLDPLL